MKLSTISTVSFMFLWHLSDSQNNPQESEFLQRSRFKSMKCSSNLELVKFSGCRVKVFSRNSSALMMNYTFSKPIVRPIQLKVVVLYKYLTIYRQVISVPELDYCGILKGSVKNPMMDLLMSVVRETLPEKLRQGCPFKGDYNLLLFVDDTKWMATSIFPTGCYKVEVKVTHTDERKLLYSVTVEIEINSPIKHSF